MTKRLDAEVAAGVMRVANLEPLDPYPGNQRKWRCLCKVCGTTVFTTLKSVRKTGGGCRPCGLRKSAKTRMLDASVAIEILRKSGAEPLDDYPGLNRPWRASCVNCKREIRPRLGNVRNGHSPCAFCMNVKVDAETAIALMLERLLAPLEPYPGSNKPWRCKCLTCNQEVAPRHASVKQGGGCIYCGFASSSRKQRTAESDAIIVMEQAGFTPLVPYMGAGRAWLSRCKTCNRDVAPTLSSVKAGIRCAYCSKCRVDPHVARQRMLEARLDPVEEFPGSKRPWRCKCTGCGNEVAPKYTDIRNGDGGCKRCANQYVDPAAAVMLLESLGVSPLEPYRSSSTPWSSKCNRCLRNVSPTYNQIQQGGNACPYCSKRKVDPEEAVALLELRGATALEPYPGSRNPWLCRCHTCNRQISVRYEHVANRGSRPCGFCAGKRVDPESAFEVMMNAGLTPVRPYFRADQPWPCICQKCHRRVQPTYTSIRTGGGCRYCANTGLDFADPTFLYVMRNDDLRAVKLGIGNHNTRANRVREHERNGWMLYKLLDFQTGDAAYEIEQSVLSEIRETHSLSPYLSKLEMPQGGWTETFDSDAITEYEIWELVVAAVSRIDLE